MTDYPRFPQLGGPPDTAHLDFYGGRLVALVFRLVDRWRCRPAAVAVRDSTSRSGAVTKLAIGILLGLATLVAIAGARSEPTVDERVPQAASTMVGGNSSLPTLGYDDQRIATTLESVRPARPQHAAAESWGIPVSEATRHGPTSGVDVVLHLVSCAADLLLCVDLDTSHLAIRDGEECEELRSSLIARTQQLHGSGGVIMGRCRLLLGKGPSGITAQMPQVPHSHRAHMPTHD